MKIVSIGEILWDLFPDGEHLGGAPFNFSAHARRLGHEVYFISAVGSDVRGSRALDRVAELGLPISWVRSISERPTGVASVSLDPSGQPHFLIKRPAAYDCLHLADIDLRRLAAVEPDWMYFGTLLQHNDHARRVTASLMDALPNTLRFYDINLRVNSYAPELVSDLMSRANVVKLNESELHVVEGMLSDAHCSLECFCRRNARRFGWKAVCVTRGADGCAVLVGDDYVEDPGYSIEVADTVGAGDAFAASFLHGLDDGWPPAEIARFANGVGALVASRDGAIPGWTPEECQTLCRAH